MFTERKEGVVPDYNIRTDRFEEAVAMTDAVSKSRVAKREERGKTLGEQAKDGQAAEAKTEKPSTGGTSDKA